MLNTQFKLFIFQKSNWACNIQQKKFKLENIKEVAGNTISCAIHVADTFFLEEFSMRSKISSPFLYNSAENMLRKIRTKVLIFLPCDWVNDGVNRLNEFPQGANGECTQ